MSIRTDLAVEAKEIYEMENNRELPGVSITKKNIGRIEISKVQVETKEGEELIGKPIGTYITIDVPKNMHYDAEIMKKTTKVIGIELAKLIKIEKSMTALIVGLGNWNVTPDALGPKVIDKIMITRHLKQLMPDSIDENIRPVCAIAPGVLGLTGMETSEIVKGIVDKIKPNLIICIDALASRKLERVNKTIQIGTSGISPGAGVGNRRMEISEKTLGVPVIAVGVPTVVHAATMANDTIDMVLDEMIEASEKGKDFYNMLKSIDKNEKEQLIKEVLNPYLGELVVTPTEVDDVIEELSEVISKGINLALQPELTIEEINQYL